MDVKKFNIITYIKPTNDFGMFAKCLSNIQKSKNINKFCILFKDKLQNSFKEELNKYNNIVWEENIDSFWASKILELISLHPADYYYIWEEDSYIFNIEQFDKSFETLKLREVDCLITQDLKWIKRAEYLLSNNLALEENNFIYFNWGTYYAKYCRDNSKDKLINGAYPVTVSAIFHKELLIGLLNNLVNSNYWEEITRGNFNHYHKNPKLPHSFEVFPGFWWEGKDGGYGNIEYSAMVSKTLYAEELGNRLINKINE